MERYKSYKVCQGCNCAIVRGGTAIQPKVGKGYSHEKKYYHKACLRSKMKGYNRGIINRFFSIIKKYDEVEVNLNNGFFGIHI